MKGVNLSTYNEHKVFVLKSDLHTNFEFHECSVKLFFDKIYFLLFNIEFQNVVTHLWAPVYKIQLTELNGYKGIYLTFFLYTIMQ